MSEDKSNDNADNLVYLDVVTRIDIPSERVLKSALEAGVESVVLAGYDKDGDEYFVSSIASGPKVLWLIERMKKRLLDASDDA